MRILGVDTSTSTASIAIVENGQIVAEDFYRRESKVTRSRAIANHSETILPLVDSVLKRAGIGLPEVAGIGVSVGPGSFTGIRIGLSTVKGLTYGTDIPALGISTLEAIAARVINFDGLVCSLLDARKNEVYSALFRKYGNQLERLSEDEIVPVRHVLDRLRRTGELCSLIGDGVTFCRALMEQSPDLQAHIGDESSMTTVAASVARLSENHFLNNRAAPVADLLPIYLRRPECESRSRSDCKYPKS